MMPIDIVRDVAKRRGIPSSVIVSGVSRKMAVAARVECTRKILEWLPETTTAELSDLFALSKTTAWSYVRRAGVLPPGPRPDQVAREIPETPDPRDVIAEVAAKWRVGVSGIMGREQTKHIAGARKAAMKAVRKRCPQMSIMDIGRLFGRDHTTICAALGTIGKNRRAAS